MTKEFSLYLHCARFIAACLVVLYHSNLRIIFTEPIALGMYGHSAVIIFFVLSGFVIAFVSETKEKNTLDFAISRCARIFSVAIPILFITPFLDIAGEHLAPVFYEGKTTHDFWYIRMISSLFFTNEIWFTSIMSFSNVPYWSLCYEVWYYVLFACMFYYKGKKKVILTSLVCLFLGPKILLLFPVWYAGVYLYRFRFKNMSEFMGWIFVLLSIILVTLFHYYNISEFFSSHLKTLIGENLHHHLTFSRFFIGDYLLAIIIVMNFAGMRRVSGRLSKGFLFCEKPITFLAGYTFTIYLIHQPFLLLYGALINGNPTQPFFYISVMCLLCFTIYFFGYFTENKKYQWKQFFVHSFDRSGKVLNKLYPKVLGRIDL